MILFFSSCSLANVLLVSRAVLQLASRWAKHLRNVEPRNSKHKMDPRIFYLKQVFFLQGNRESTRATHGHPKSTDEKHDHQRFLQVSLSVVKYSWFGFWFILAKYLDYISPSTKFNTSVKFGFRTKKMEADIARVETEEDGERMGVIRWDFYCTGSWWQQFWKWNRVWFRFQILTQILTINFAI